MFNFFIVESSKYGLCNLTTNTLILMKSTRSSQCSIDENLNPSLKLFSPTENERLFSMKTNQFPNLNRNRLHYLNLKCMYHELTTSWASALCEYHFNILTYFI